MLQNRFKNTFFFFLYVILFCPNQTKAQKIIAGPIVGAVTDSSARMVIFFDKTTFGEVQVSTDENFHYILSFPFSANSYKTTTVSILKLQPNTSYYYRVLLDPKLLNSVGSFKTFPQKNDTTHFTFTFGSCTEQHHNDSIFIEMRSQNPLFFLHLGDWLYQNSLKNDAFYFTQNIEHQQELYQKRYEMPNLKKLLNTTSIDFVFDDEDGVCDDFSKKSYCVIKQDGKETEIKEVELSDTLIRTVLQGYHQFFPTYSQEKNKAYHNFVCGNTEIFFLDTRSTRSPNSEVFTKTKQNRWTYKVPNNHDILDTLQLNWLLDKLQHSTADWKFIVSGVTFNKSYKKVLDICMKMQHRILPNKMNGAYVAASLASMWFAFPNTEAAILNFCNEHKIKNVIILSGDAHTAAIDNGKNAGFPELLAGGLAQKNSRLVSIIKNDLRLNLWNKGGQGIHNTNFNDAFGKVEILGKDAVKLSVIDKYGVEICSYLVKDGFIPKKYNAKDNSSIQPKNKLRAIKNCIKIGFHHLVKK